MGALNPLSMVWLVFVVIVVVYQYSGALSKSGFSAFSSHNPGAQFRAKKTWFYHYAEAEHESSTRQKPIYISMG